MPRTRLSAGLYLLLVFASGILVGVVSHRLYVTSTVSATSPTPTPTSAEVRQKYLTDMRAKVGLSDKQSGEVNSILDKTKQKFDALHASEKPMRDKIQQEQIDEISALLTPAQKTAYDQWRAERARLHAQEQQKRQQQQQKK